MSLSGGRNKWNGSQAGSENRCRNYTVVEVRWVQT